MICQHEQKKDLTQSLGFARHYYCPECGTHWYAGREWTKAAWEIWVNEGFVQKNIGESMNYKQKILAIGDGFTKEYRDVHEAAEKTGLKESVVYSCLKRGNRSESGYCFDYVIDN